MSRREELKARIAELVTEFHDEVHAPREFVPGKTRIQYSGRVYDAREILNCVDAALDFWLTHGPYADRFERSMRGFFDSRDFATVNSGSSAILTMVSTLCSPNLARHAVDGPGPLRPGDEVLTPAVTFPTTLAPIVQNRLTPLFVDCEIGTYNVDPTLVEDAIGPRTRAILVPHTVGIPFAVSVLAEIAERRGLWLLEDCCDALGATWEGKLCGTFGAMASLSFFPAHQMTMGEGGGVVVNARGLQRTVRSVRDWGRDCWCEPGCSDTCGHRFDWQLGELPRGYDHKYVYSNLGYNLKITEMQAAIGLAQLDKVEGFIAARRRNFDRLMEALSEYQEYLILPKVDPRANPSPFGFPITVREGVERIELVRHLEAANVETRLVFGGNILRQPGYLNVPRRVHGSLERSDAIMHRTFFIGVYPGLTDAMIDYVIEQFAGFFS